MTPTGGTPLLWKEITKYPMLFLLPTVNMVLITKLNNCFLAVFQEKMHTAHREALDPPKRS